MNQINSHPFDIERIKTQLDACSNLKEQLRLLYRIRTVFLQDKHEFKNLGPVPFDKQVDHEISYRNFAANYKAHNLYDLQNRSYPIKLRVVGKLKPLVLSFYALLQHKGNSGLNYLSINEAQLIHFLSNVLQYPDDNLVPWEDLSMIINPNLVGKKEAFHNNQTSNALKTISQKRFYQYDIKQVRKTLESILLFEHRFLFIHRLKANFRQHAPSNDSTELFAEQMDLELQLQQQDFDLGQDETDESVPLVNRIRVNGRINVLITFFYTLLVELPRHNKIVTIDNSKQEIIAFIYRHFESEKGKRIKSSSTRTILTPSKAEKRCTRDRQIHIKQFWNLG